jgi:hypothetical protein
VEGGAEVHADQGGCHREQVCALSMFFFASLGRELTRLVDDRVRNVRNVSTSTHFALSTLRQLR